MKRTKRILTGALALTMLLALLAGCSGTPASAGVPAGSSAPAGSESVAGGEAAGWKTETISILTNTPAMPEGNDTQLWMEGELGFKINFQVLPDDEMKTKLNLLASSDELPDITTIPSYMGDIYDNLVKQQKLLDIEALIQEYAPNVLKWRTQEQLDSLREDDGKIYAINNVTATVYDMMLIRQDWLDKYDLEPPATLEEFEAVCEKFINEDPDGNGTADTKGYTCIGIYGLSPFFQAFGSNPFGWVWENGEKGGTIVQGATQPETLEAVKYLNSLVNKGYIDKDYLTVTYEKQQELVSTNQTGFCYTELWFAGENNATYKTSPETNWVGMLPPAGPEGDSGYLTSSNPELRGYTVFAANSKDPAASMAYINFIADKDNYYRTRLGIEGVHYEMVDGMTQNIGQYAEDITLFTTEGIGFSYAYCFMLEDPPTPAVEPKCLEALQLRRGIEEKSYAAWYWPVNNPMQIAEGWSDAFMEDLNRLIMEGGDFDAEWQAMVDRAYNDYKLGELEALVNEQYQKKYG